MSVRIAAVGLMLVALTGCGAALPPAIREEMTTTSRVQAGASTVVFFTDFQCPFCRATHKRLAPLLAQRGDHVRVVLRHVPLPRHPDARGAAEAAICFERLTEERLRGHDPREAEKATLDYADALFATQDLSPIGCSELAEARGIDRARLEACTAEPSTKERIMHDIELFEAVHGEGVPLLFVGKTRLEGAQSATDLAEALDHASP